MIIRAKNFETAAYLALPQNTPGPGILVLHAWWGLNEDVKTVCDQLAQAGYVALAPDLYNGRIATTIEEAEQYSEQMDEAAASELAQAAATVLHQHEACRGSRIGVIGFSLGASYAVRLAFDQPKLLSAVVVFYGLGWTDHTKTQASYLGHFAANDPYEDDDYRDQFEQKLRENGRPVTFHIYPGTGHWFFEPGRPDAFNPGAAELAWTRTLDFLKETV